MRVFQRHFEWVRRHPNPLMRRGAGVLLIIGGILGFLPVLGFWMIPLGLLLLSDDVPWLRRWRRAQFVRWGRRWGAVRRSVARRLARGSS